MPTLYKVLGQSAPSSNTDTTLYTVPALTDTVVSTINAVNTGSTSANIRVAIRPAGATLAKQHYIVYDLTLVANAIFTYTAGITIDTTDVITVRASTADVAFSAFGSEIS